MNCIRNVLIVGCASVLSALTVEQSDLCAQERTRPPDRTVRGTSPADRARRSRSLEMRPATESLLRVFPMAEWTTKTHNGANWDTTSNPIELASDESLGAKILRFRDGRYVQTIHRQYPAGCGPTSLAMTLHQLGARSDDSLEPLTDRPDVVSGRGSRPRRKALLMSRDVDIEGVENVNVGYRGSIEHLMWLGYHRKRLVSGMANWNADRPLFMTPGGELNTDDSADAISALSGGANLNYLTGTMIPQWLALGPPIGCGGPENYYAELPGIMNYIFSGGSNGPWRDARPLPLHGQSDAEVVAIRRIIKGFIDHDLSIVCGVDSGRHFNTVIGYRGQVTPASADFWVYTADPLDGGGNRPDSRRPGTWRRMLVNQQTLGDQSGLFMLLIVWNQHADGNVDVGFQRGTWAQNVDRLNGNDWLTGSDWLPAEQDPLNDELARPAQRLP